MDPAFESSAVALDVPEPDAFEALLDGRYRVVGRLGGGGMGDVYEVEHERLKRRFALKVLRRELTRDRALTERFDREARAVAKLHSDYVVSIVDSGALADGRPYFVMERLLGQDLRQLLSSAGPLPVTRAVNLAIDACLGLHAAHSASLVHRDLKPENLFVTRSDDGRERCKLLDFGVVKLGEQDHTRPGVLVGTARYMAPEQVAHGAAVGAPADLFALGVILYRCLSGEHPFAADSLERVLFRIMNESPTPLAELAPHVPSGLSTVVSRLLAKSPRDRPGSALELARALAPFAGEPRHLAGVEGWHIETMMGEDPSTAGDATPAVNDEGAVSPAPPRSPVIKPLSRPNWRALAFGGLLLALPLASMAYLGRRTQPPTAVTARATNRSLDTASLGIAPSVVEHAAPLSVAAALSTGPAPAPARAASAPNHSSKTRPASSAGAPSAPSSARPGVNWFDPRNPYGN